jgi:predicted secreted acid phosphatase
MSTAGNTIKDAAMALVVVLLAGAYPAVSSPCQDIKVPEDAERNANRRTGLKFTYTSQYRRDFDQAIRTAREACKKHLGEPNLAIVADIDETLLDNREEIALHPDFSWPQFWSWMRESKAPVLKPTAKFLSWARKHGFAIFLITGRQEDLRRATILNLVACHVYYDGLFMRDTHNDQPAETIKLPYRQAIEKMGFKIIVNIGDQWSDLTGGHAETCVKLPNRMYFVR